MRTAVSLHRSGDWPADRARACVTLAWADRHRRRIVLADDAGQDFLLDLPEASLMADGDGLKLLDGGWIAVRAASEAVADVSCPHVDDLLRIAWHIGNRHAPMQLLADGALRIQDDHVLVDMVLRLGGSVARRRAPFHAEGGAYAGEGHHHG